MSNELVDILKSNSEGPLRLSFSDGEVLYAKRLTVLEEEDLIAFELVESNRPDKYEKTDERPGLVARLSELVECEPIQIE